MSIPSKIVTPDAGVLSSDRDPSAVVVDDADLPPMDETNSVPVKNGRKRIPGSHIHGWKVTHKVNARILMPAVGSNEAYEKTTVKMPIVAVDADDAARIYAASRSMIPVRQPDGYGLVWPNELTEFETEPKSHDAADEFAAAQELTAVERLDGTFAMAVAVHPMTVETCSPN